MLRFPRERDLRQIRCFYATKTKHSRQSQPVFFFSFGGGGGVLGIELRSLYMLPLSRPQAPNILYTTKKMECTWWMIIVRMIGLCSPTPEEDLLFEIHLLQTIIWGMCIFFGFRRFDSFILLPANIKQNQKILIWEEQIHWQCMNFKHEWQTRLWRIKMHPFFRVPGLRWGMEFLKRTGLPQETNLRRKSLIDF